VNFRSRTLRAVAVAVALATTVAGGLLVNAASADISTTPPWQEAGAKDVNAVRTLAFYDATTGTQVTSGSTTAPFPYVVASGAVRAGDTNATLFAYTPVSGTAPGAWSTGTQLTATKAYPLAGAPAGVPTGVPAIKGAAGDTTLANQIVAFPNASNAAGYQGVFELRLRTSSTAKGVGDGYAVADLVVTGNTWTVYGTAPAKVDSTTAAVVPANGTYGTGFQVTTTVSAAGGTPTGSVTLKEGGTTIGSAVALNGSGQATFNVSGTALAAGAHDLAVSYPGSPAYNASASTPSTITIAKATAVVTPTVPAKAAYGTAFRITATVGPGVPTGTATLKSGATVVSTVNLAAGKATFTVAGTKFAPGTRAFTVTFNGSTSLNASTSTAKNTVIAKATAKAANALSPKKIKHTKAAKLTVKVTAPGVVPTGVVSIFDGTKLIKRVTLTAAKKGTIVVVLPKLKKGSHKIHAVYAGSATVNKATAANVVLKST
jgi:hypothetical protein